MIWSVIGLSSTVQHPPLIQMVRDPESPRNGYSAYSYILALEQGLLPIYNSQLLFQQDNAPIHKAQRTTE